MKIRVDRKNNSASVRIDGVMGDSSAKELHALSEIKSASEIGFDFEKLEMINSMGAHAWTKFIQSIAGDVRIRFERCPTFFVDFGNIAHQFFGHGIVASLYIPFLCDECGNRFLRLYTRDQLAELVGDFALPCGKCAKKADSEVFLDDFLMAVRRQDHGSQK